MKPGTPTRFVAVLEDVRDVSLTGLADAAVWSSLVRTADLQLARKYGKAQLALTAVSARYMGIPFREVSISILVRHPEQEATGNCPYLPCAFNSSRFFAFVERTWFHTPYFPAYINVDAQVPVGFAATRRDGLALVARMDGDAPREREPIRSGPDSWEGPIFLPPRRTADGCRRRWFAARLAGDTHVYPFVPSRDELVVTPSPRFPVMQLLADSGFAGQEWAVRESALHARSKTYGQEQELLIAQVEAPALESPGYG